MILGFKEQINGKPTYFAEKILSTVGVKYIHQYLPKKHSIREGNRWKAGLKIHMALHVRSKKYIQFNKNYPELQECKSVQTIEIKWKGDFLEGVFVDGKTLTSSQIETLAMYDGFDSTKDFFLFFNKDFQGQIVHWTDLKY